MAKRVFFQAGFWILFFLFWYQIVYIYVGDPGNRLLFTFFDVSLIMTCFYFVYAFAVPELLLKKKRMLFFITVIAGIALSSVIVIWLLKQALHSNLFLIRFRISWNFSDLYNNRFYIALFGTIAGLVTRLSLEWANAKKRIRQVEHEKIKAELAYLKNQINPHFLFNALNTIFFQLDESPERAKDSLVKFSDILRYQLYDCIGDQVPVIKEIGYLDNYVRIQSLRKGSDCRIGFTFDTTWHDEQVAPLLLIPFVENAFKYVSDLPDTEHMISISIEKKEGQLCFTCINTYDEAAIPGKGLGIPNVKRRLELIYPGRHLLTVSSANKCFTVQLNLEL